MITAAGAARRRWGLRDDDESPYVSLPYGSPSSDQYFGPAQIGGPPGSRVSKRSFRSRNAYTSEIVLRLQQRFQKDFESNDTKLNDLHLNNRFSSGMYNKSLEQKVTNSNPDVRSQQSIDVINNSTGFLDKYYETNNLPENGYGNQNYNASNNVINVNNTEQTGKQISRHSSVQDVSYFHSSSVTPKNIFMQETGWKSFDYSYGDSDVLNRSAGAVSVSAIFVKDIESADNHEQDKKEIPYITVGEDSETTKMSEFEDYESIQLCDQPVVAVPPSKSQCITTKAPLSSFNEITNLNAEQCREAIVQFASNKCCYGQKPALEHDIIEIKPTTTLHYILETFCEIRSVEFTCEPYGGEELESPAGVIPPPQPWAIPCEPDRNFHQHTKRLRIPNTTTIKDCDKCGGCGKLVCTYCSGSGCVECIKCQGQGLLPHYLPSAETTKMLPCSTCNGVRKTRCSMCDGDGHLLCMTCDGGGRLKCYLRLIVKYTTHHDDFVMEEMELPSALHDRVSGILIFQQEQPQIWPLCDYPVSEIAENSELLVKRHKAKCPHTKHIQQRQSIWAIPVTEVVAQWKGSWKSHYWIYGKDRHVYCPDYPHKCCGCLGATTCTIL